MAVGTNSDYFRQFLTRRIRNVLATNFVWRVQQIVMVNTFLKMKLVNEFRHKDKCKLFYSYAPGRIFRILRAAIIKT